MPAGVPSRVLIVDDDPGAAAAYARLVGTLDRCRLVGRVSGLEAAWKVLSTEPVTLLILGCAAERLDAAMALLRRMRYLGLSIDVLFISPAASMKTVRDAQRLGAFDYMVSPVSPARFLESVARVVELDVSRNTVLRQRDIDRMRELAVPTRDWLPRDISAPRLAAVRAFVLATPGPLSAAALAAALGMSRVTARRYLEYLVTLGELDVDAAVTADRPGRPSKFYEHRALHAV